MDTTIQFSKKAFLLLFCILLFTNVAKSQIKVNESGDLHIGYEDAGTDYYPRLIIGAITSSYPGGKWNFAVKNSTLHIASGHRNNAGNGFYLVESGKLGIGKSPASPFFLDVNGAIAVRGVQVHASDERLKTNIQSLSGLTSNLYLLEGKSYMKSLPELASKEGNQISSEESFQEYGFLAQELRALFPELVVEDEEGYLSVNYIGLIPVVIEALKEQKQEIETLKATISPIQLRSSPSIQGVTDIQTIIDEITAKCQLYQNTPNPFSESTEISFLLPENATQAYICIFDMQGTMLKKTNNLVGQTNILIQGSELNAGMYLYSLIVDGKEMDTKRMILTK